MIKKILFFLSLIFVFIILMILSNIELNFDNLFLGMILSNKIWFLIVVGIGIFIYGKKIIDSFNE
ncbi:MAG: hypothetical protein PHH98_00835 [Candidatus Gracilibacteria bacterium]|nr:hypothetical protein [Candidatus Gracilibacteria bacterium]